MAHGVEPKAFNFYGARRGTPEIMVRGPIANTRPYYFSDAQFTVPWYFDTSMP